jgi:hypothetical protein
VLPRRAHEREPRNRNFVRGWNAALAAIAGELDQQFALPYPRALARAR